MIRPARDAPQALLEVSARAVAVPRTAGTAEGRDGARAHLELADTLAQTGRIDEALDTYRRALELQPDNAEAHLHLGFVLVEAGRLAEGFEHLLRRAELVRGADDVTVGSPSAPRHKLKHDDEQLAYLLGRGILTHAAQRDLFHLGDGRSLAGPAVKPGNITRELVRCWRTSWPQMAVIDDFLTPQALQKLRAYCAESTIWRRVYDAGYIGAAPHDGLACPLLTQIAEETRTTYGEILAPHPFRYLGAFKYDSELSAGTNTHADFSAVNVNLYIAPDEANLDPASGGMLVWDAEAADEAEMRRMNSDEQALQMRLNALGARATRVPHRANRAIIFKSSLFHKTDECRFSEGYLNRRINVSLLYGDWGAAI